MSKKNMVLKGLRAELGWGQREMANYLNIALETYNRKENGKLPFKDTEINAILRLSKKSYEEIFLTNFLTNSQEQQKELGQ